MMSLSKSSCDKMTRCSLRRTVFRPLYELLDTSKLCTATIAAKLMPEVSRSLEEGDLVLRRVQSAKNSNKLTPKWEGPYRVKQVTRPGAVRLETEDGIPVSNSWNIEHLRKFYP